jgi:hypothetical protein
MELPALYVAPPSGDKRGGLKELAMARILPRFLILAAFAAIPAFGQPPNPNPGSAVPPGGMADRVTGREATIGEQIDDMNRHINGEHQNRAGSSAHADRARPATAAEVVAGAAVSDSAGAQIGTIVSVDAGGAIILTAVGQARIPLNAFGKNSHGLLLGTTKAQFEATVARANATPG